MFFYVLDLLGVGVFAVSGALAAGRIGLDVFGVVVVAALPAVGGGTLRDLLLGRHPVFWIRDPRYLYVILASALLTMAFAQWIPVVRDVLLVADTLGLALFALSGAQVAQAARCPAIVVVLMGTMTGVAGGVLRDVLTGQIPLILRKDIYATAAIAGIVLYLALQTLGARRTWAFAAGLVTVAAVRLLALRWGWQLPTFNL